ncbi:hypothetical protein AA0473_0697 [Acetobacter orleanensis NRIC 0473]|nr:hypothetical protein AA0473_0697 [Acetobacter orleanensis NRIC 0473]
MGLFRHVKRATNNFHIGIGRVTAHNINQPITRNITPSGQFRGNQNGRITPRCNRQKW